MTDAATPLSLSPTADGCLITVQNRATVRESRSIKEVASRALAGNETARVVIDLSKCSYVDSTFLGTLIDLHRLAVARPPGRLQIAAPAAHRKQLLGVARLDKLIPGLDAPPPTAGPAVPLGIPDATPRQVAQHIMECHEKLAEVDCPMRAVFARIASQMRQELDLGKHD